MKGAHADCSVLLFQAGFPKFVLHLPTRFEFVCNRRSGDMLLMPPGLTNGWGVFPTIITIRSV